MRYLENKGKLVKPIGIRFSERADREIDEACEKLSMAKQDVVRLATDIGLEYLRTVKYNLAKCVLNESGRLKK